MVYNDCPSLYIFIGNFVIRLKVAIIKIVSKKENLRGKAKFIWEMI